MILFYAIVGIFLLILSVGVAYFLIKGYGFKDFIIYSIGCIFLYVIGYVLTFAGSLIGGENFLLNIVSYIISAAGYFILYSLTCVILFGIVSVLPGMEFHKKISSKSYYGLASSTFVFLFIAWCLVSYIGSHRVGEKIESGIVNHQFLPTPSEVLSEAIKLLLTPKYEVTQKTITSLEKKVSSIQLDCIKSLKGQKYTKTEFMKMEWFEISNKTIENLDGEIEPARLMVIDKLRGNFFTKKKLDIKLKKKFNQEEIGIILVHVEKIKFSDDDVKNILKFATFTMDFYYHLWVSIYRIFIGFGLAVILAVPLGILMGSFKPVEAIFNPLFSFVRYMPPTAFISLLIIWTAIDSVPSYLIFIGVFFYLLVLIMDHVANVPRELLETAYTLGAIKLEVLTMVIFPYSLPGILDSCKAMIGAAWTYLIAAELVGGMGIGYTIMKAQRFLRTPEVFVSIICIGIIGIITNTLFELAYRWLFPWKISERTR